MSNDFVRAWRKTEKRLRKLDEEIEEVYKGWRPAKRQKTSHYRRMKDHDTRWIDEQLEALKQPLTALKAKEKGSAPVSPKPDDQRLDEIINKDKKLDKSQARVIRSRFRNIVLYVYEMRSHARRSPQPQNTTNSLFSSTEVPGPAKPKQRYG